MIKKYWLMEDKLPPKLLVTFSSKLYKEIKAIDAYNKNNVEALYQWRDYLYGMKRYLSDSTIAWDNMGRYPRFPNGARFIRDFNYNVGYTIKINNNTNLPYVYVFKANLNLEQYGLKVPPTVKENVLKVDAIITETINKYLRKHLLLAS